MTPKQFALAVPIALMLATAGDAYSVQPMVYTLTPSGAGTTTRVTVTNTHETVLNVEVQPFAVSADNDGKRSFTPAEDQFLIFPPQASVLPGRVQLFQVRYVGPPTLAKGRVYVLRIHQTNTTALTREDTTSQSPTKLNVSLHFNTTAIVQPRDFTPDLVISQDLAMGADGRLHGALTNRGPGVADLSRFVWSIERAGQVERVPGEKVRYGDAVFIEPGARRDFSLDPSIKGPARLILEPSAAGRGTAKGA